MMPFQRASYINYFLFVGFRDTRYGDLSKIDCLGKFARQCLSCGPSHHKPKGGQRHAFKIKTKCQHSCQNKEKSIWGRKEISYVWVYPVNLHRIKRELDYVFLKLTASNTGSSAIFLISELLKMIAWEKMLTPNIAPRRTKMFKNKPIKG